MSLAFSIFISISVFIISVQGAYALPLREKPTLDVLMFVYDKETQDYFYSFDIQEIQDAILEGYDDYDKPSRYGIVGYLEKTEQEFTAPLMRVSRANKDIFMSADPTEIDAAIAYGYSNLIEYGYLYLKSLPGTRAVYRLGKYNFTLKRRTYVYSMSSEEIANLMTQGYEIESYVGDLYEKATDNLTPRIEYGLILGRRCFNDVFYCGGETYRDYYFNQTFNVLALFKPGLTNYHQLTFDFITWNGLGVDTGHSAIMLRNSVEFDPDNLLKTRFDGVGIIIGAYGCPGNTGDQVTVELWRPDTGQNGQAYVDCEMMSPSLEKGRKYSFILRAHNDGTFYYGIFENGKLFFEATKNIKSLYENMGGIYRKFPQPNQFSRENMKYSILHANDARLDFTQYYLNVNSIWY